MVVNAKKFLLKRRMLVKELTTLIIKRMTLNDEIKIRRNELRSLDNLITHMGENEFE